MVRLRICGLFTTLLQALRKLFLYFRKGKFRKTGIQLPKTGKEENRGFAIMLKSAAAALRAKKAA